MIWDFQDALTRRLLLWSALSIAAGSIMLVAGDAWWRGFGLQAVVWGAIDAGIALFGRRAAEKHRAGSGTGWGPAEREAHRLKRLLWINTGLDVLYIAGGAVLAGTAGRSDPFAAGTGWGIVVQGGFLFIFDLLHALAVPRKEPELPLAAAFADVEHRPFVLEDGRPAALLVHGFGGTPAELRPLAEALHRAGWTVAVPLLPGFGADIGTLTQRRCDDWLAAVKANCEVLAAQGHRPLLLVGYSMGAAASIAVEREIRPVGLVLLAPFWWDEKPWFPLIEFFVRPFLPTGFRPMRKADLNSAQVREAIDKFVPGLDLDDPQVQTAVRDFRVPLGLIDQLRHLSRRVAAAAPGVTARVLVVQGSRDSVARPARSRKLVAKLPAGADYVEVDSEHDLILPANGVYHQVEALVVSHARTSLEDAR